MALKNPLTGGVWTTVSLQSGYTVTGSPYATPSYRKDSFNIVYLRGRATYSSGNPTTILALPTGFRPAANAIFVLPSTDPNGIVSTVWLEMKTNGNLDYIDGNGRTISFESMFFATY